MNLKKPPRKAEPGGWASTDAAAEGMVTGIIVALDEGEMKDLVGEGAAGAKGKSGGRG